jgi:hypothetical protein
MVSLFPQRHRCVPSRSVTMKTINIRNAHFMTGRHA